jgi:LPPG:FO 2-phospho-L-lactate transferase
MKTAASEGRVIALCGGVGGAKLALGLYRVLAPGQLSVIVNTGDDFEHLGFAISPDLDTVLYTLGGVADRRRGWGRADESWNFMETIGRLGGETWFQLGDRDLAMHVSRTAWLRGGGKLSEFARRAAAALNIAAQIVPMSDDAVRTMLETDEGELPFQHYFVRRHCEPSVSAISFAGAATAMPADGIFELLSDPGLRAIVICPSNPYLSVDPILALPGMREALANSIAPVVAVSPLIGGHAVKGPTAKIMRELGIAVNNDTVAAHYRGLIDGLLIDRADAADAADEAKTAIAIMVTRTMMKTLADRERLAGDIVAFADALARRHVAARAAGAGR